MLQIIGKRLTFENNGRLADAVTRYVLRLTDLTKVKTELEFLTDAQKSNLKDRILNNYGVSVVFKCGLLSYIRKEINWIELNAMFIQEGYPWLSDMLHLVKHNLDDYRRKVKVSKLDYPIIPKPEEIRAFAEKELLEVKPWIARFVHRKFSFLDKSDSIKFREITSDLEAKAIQTVYHAIPFKTRLHVHNSMKRAIHNAGINIIKNQTAKKRARVVQDGDQGFSTRLLYDGEGTLTAELAANSGVVDDLDIRLSCGKVICNSLLSPQYSEAIKILVCEHQEFFTYCCRKGYKAQDRDDLFYVMGQKEYMNMARKYLKWSYPQMRLFLEEIRQRVS